MYLRHQNITVPYINSNGTVPSLATDVAMIGDGLRATIDNVRDIASFIEAYVDNAIRKNEKQITEKIASRTYEIISEMMECNIRKEEFIKLLEMSDDNDQMQ